MEYVPTARGKGNLKFCMMIMNPITNEVRACETIRDLTETIIHRRIIVQAIRKDKS